MQKSICKSTVAPELCEADRQAAKSSTLNKSISSSKRTFVRHVLRRIHSWDGQKWLSCARIDKLQSGIHRAPASVYLVTPCSPGCYSERAGLHWFLCSTDGHAHIRRFQGTTAATVMMNVTEEKQFWVEPESTRQKITIKYLCFCSG